MMRDLAYRRFAILRSLINQLRAAVIVADALSRARAASRSRSPQLRSAGTLCESRIDIP